MGASTSAINYGRIQITEEEYKQGTKSLFRKEDFNAFAESNRMLSIDSLVNIFNEKYDVFFSYDHDEDLESRNIKRITKINEALKARGLRTCFMTEEVKTSLQRQEMLSKIDHSSCAVIFISQRYMTKILSNASDEAKDVCELQFYQALKKQVDRMVSVVLEGRCRRKQDWVGEVGMVLGSRTFVDFSADDNFDEVVEDVYRNVLNAAGQFTIKQMIESEFWSRLVMGKLTQDLAALQSSLATSPLPALSKPIKRPTGLSLEEEFAAWMVLHAGIASERANEYAARFVAENIGSAERLRKKVAKHPRLLFEKVRIDEKDAVKLTKVMEELTKEREREERPGGAAGGSPAPSSHHHHHHSPHHAAAHNHNSPVGSNYNHHLRTSAVNAPTSSAAVNNAHVNNGMFHMGMGMGGGVGGGRGEVGRGLVGQERERQFIRVQQHQQGIRTGGIVLRSDEDYHRPPYAPISSRQREQGFELHSDYHLMQNSSSLPSPGQAHQYSRFAMANNTDAASNTSTHSHHHHSGHGRK